VHALTLFVALAAALAIAPGALRALDQRGLRRPNYRTVPLPTPAGVIVPAAAALALGPLALVRELAGGSLLEPELPLVLIYCFGVAGLGLIDDLLGGPARGWRGHGSALVRGELSTGALKAGGALGLALYGLSGQGRGAGNYLLAAAVLVLVTNLFNLLDLRPGRSLKAFVLLGLGLTLGSWDLTPLWTLGLFVGPILVVGAYDLRERAMLGDTGASLIGAVAGLWLVFTLSTAGLAIAAALIAAITIYGEFRSISDLIERIPLLRHLDSAGRPLHA
jgi:UDP-N-acetylmuramyl pentapeptide phosphotransferase/UDP-N-acetylglucosamine-1-phosphate transferase